MVEIDPSIERQYVFSDRYPSRPDVYAEVAAGRQAARAQAGACLVPAHGGPPM